MKHGLSVCGKTARPLSPSIPSLSVRTHESIIHRMMCEDQQLNIRVRHIIIWVHINQGVTDG
jgi:hypothetical protein